MPNVGNEALFLLALWLACAIATGLVAQRRGHGYGLWAVLGLVLGPLALLFSLTLRPTPGADEAERLRGGGRRCPHCAEVIQAQANVCRFCGRDVPAA